MAHAHHTIAELRKLDAAELRKQVTEKKMDAMKLRLGLEAGSDKDSSKHRRIRKEIARTLTALNEKRLPKAGQLKTSAKDSTVSAPHSPKGTVGSAPKPAAKRARKS